MIRLLEGPKLISLPEICKRCKERAGVTGKRMKEALVYDIASTADDESQKSYSRKVQH